MSAHTGKAELAIAKRFFMQGAWSFVPILLLVVWILKREVRAFGGCLGTYRR